MNQRNLKKALGVSQNLKLADYTASILWEEEAELNGLNEIRTFLTVPRDGFVVIMSFDRSKAKGQNFKDLVRQLEKEAKDAHTKTRKASRKAGRKPVKR